MSSITTSIVGSSSSRQGVKHLLALIFTTSLYEKCCFVIIWSRDWQAGNNGRSLSPHTLCLAHSPSSNVITNNNHVFWVFLGRRETAMPFTIIDVFQKQTKKLVMRRFLFHFKITKQYLHCQSLFFVNFSLVSCEYVFY